MAKAKSKAKTNESREMVGKQQKREGEKKMMGFFFSFFLSFGFGLHHSFNHLFCSLTHSVPLLEFQVEQEAKNGKIAGGSRLQVRACK